MVKNKQQAQNPVDSKIRSVLAREEDGTIQLTITIPAETIKRAEEEVLLEVSKTTEIPGYRRGNAPIEEVKKRVMPQTVLERILSKILPRFYQEAIIEHKIRPILSPQFQLISAESGKDWQIRAITCEAPRVELGDYKKEIQAARRAKALWIPGKNESATASSGQGKISSEGKEQIIIETLLKTTKCTIPKPLLDEEVNHRLATLVDQTQKLGLTVEQYLAQTGKTPNSIREEYQEQAKQQLHIVLALSLVADQEGITVLKEEIEAFATSQTNGEKKPASPEQKQLIGSIIRRRKALDRLTSLV